jgi:exodeoxyribonuclease V beta subunit
MTAPTMATELNLQTSPFDPGLTVVEASAGTGKTYSISHIVPRLLLEGALPDLAKLLLVTFTKDAARELADRVRRVLTRLAAPPTSDEATTAKDIAALRPLLENPEAKIRLNRALLDLDLLAVSTIHAFCQRTLQQEGSLCGLPVLPEVITDDTEHLEPIVRKQWVETLSADPVLAALATAQQWNLDDALKFINTRRRCLLPQTEPKPENYAQLRTQFEAQCTTLANPADQTTFTALVHAVPKWNGRVTASSVLTDLAPLFRPAPQTLAFWQSLAAATDLPKRIYKKTNAGKAAAADITACSWFAAATELHALASQLHWSWQQKLADDAIPVLATLMARHRLITQDGLIGALYHALHRTGSGAEQSTRLANRLAERYHVALIDESQDTDPRQFSIFKRIFLEADPRRILLLVGDPKQAIYSFRGADLSTYLAARDTAQAKYTLRHTHRAPSPLVTVINTLFERSAAFLNPGMVFTPTASALTYDRELLRQGQPCSRLEVWTVPEADKKAYSAQARRTAALSQRIASTIVDLLAHGQLRTTDKATGTVLKTTAVTPKDFAVLVATNAQADGMADALQSLGVPAVINSGADVFDTEEARDLHLLLRAILEPRRTSRLRRALATRLLGLDAAALAALDTPPTEGALPVFSTWLEKFGKWQSTWAQHGLVALFTELEKPIHRLPDAETPSADSDHGVTHRLALMPLSGERRATNYRHLTDLLLEAAREDAPRPEELVRWLGQQIAQADSRSDAEDRQLQLSSDRAAVQVVTMHKAKGLEYPLVFCPYLADPIKEPKSYEKLPGRPTTAEPVPADTLLNLDLLDETTKNERKQQLMSAQLEERLRLTYVALTRAQVRVWTSSYRPGKWDFGSPLDWLLRNEPELTTHTAYTPEWAELAKDGGTARHEAALTALGAQSRSTPDSDADSDSEAPLITFLPVPDPSDLHHQSMSEPASETTSESTDALPAPTVPKSWRITSFSTLTREKHAHGAPSAATLVSASSGAITGVTLTPPPELAPPASLFLTAPAGADVGTIVHDWIETWDFSPLSPTDDLNAPLTRYLTSVSLPSPRPEQSDLTQALPELFTHLRDIRLPGCGDTPLHEICPEAHGSEWNFHLPLVGGLTAGVLARCFEDHAAPEHRDYAPILAALDDQKTKFDGLLQGFIDRLARHGPAWGVIDWKTNRLGLSLADYDEPALLRCAMDSHYLLQTHLYLVALRRYLRSLGLADTPLAGAWLVFLRAIAPGQTRGVLHIQPPAAMLDALDELFAPATSSLTSPCV